MNSKFYYTYQARLLLLFISLFGFISNTQGQNIVRFAGNGTPGSTGDGGQATAAQLTLPLDVTVDAAGNAYIADWSSSRVRKVSPSGVISTFAGTGTMGFSGDGGPASAAQIIEAAGVATDAAGNVYVADFDNHRVRKINTAGIISTYVGTGSPGYSGDGFPATAAQIGSPWGLTVDGAGNLYVSDEYQHRIRKVNSAGIISTYVGTGVSGFSGDGGPATAAQIGQPSYMATDAAGNLYIADYDNSRVRMVTPSGIISTVAGNGGFGFSGDGGQATAATLWEPIGVAVDAGGNLYINDYANRRVRKVNAAGIISTIAGTGTSGSSGDGGPATAATFNVLYGIHVDGAQNIYVADAYNMKIRKIVGYNRAPAFAGGHSQSLTVCQNTVGDSVNNLLAVLDSDSFQLETWSMISPPVHGTAVAGYTVISNGTTLTPTGTFYTPTAGYTGLDSFKVRVTDGVASDTTTIHITVSAAPPALTGTLACFVGSYTTLADASSGGTWVSSPAAVATVSSGGVVAGLSPGTVTITYTLPSGCLVTTTVSVSPFAGLTITTVAGNGVAGYSADAVPATASALNNPYSMAVDAAGNIYIADAFNFRVRKVNTAGIISTIAGTGVSGYTGDGGPATAAQTRSALAMATDAAGNIFFADQNNHCIRKINAAGIITTVAGSGSAGFFGDGLAATIAQLNSPTGICLDASGNLFIADALNHRVRKVNTSGIISTIAGNGLIGYSGDGMAATATQLTRADGVAVDGAGNVYITDFDNNRVRMINTSGIISTFSGNGTPGYLGDGFPATTAELNLPFGVAIDGLGNIYSSDYGSQHIRKVNTSGIITTIAGNGITGYAGDNCAATAGEFHDPGGVAVDRIGNIYVADVHNNRIRKISYNRAPAFAGGHRQVTSMCQNSVDSVNTLLAMTDVDVTQGETWASYISPLHGSLVASYSANSTGSLLTPVGLSYTPTAAYAGLDSFSVIVTDCSGGADTTKVVITISPAPSAIVGASAICAGTTTVFSDTVGIGTWSSSNTSFATVTTGPANTALVTGVSGGTVNITYSPGAGCAVTKSLTINAAPSPISGTLSVCRGFSTPLGDATPGGTWSSTASATANVGTAGIVFGASVGTATISYTIGGCAATAVVTVNTNPTLISGVTSICIGGTTPLFDGLPGGTWSSSIGTVATVDPVSGAVFGTGPGSTTITYVLSTGCSSAATVTVYSLPAAITGTLNVCIGSTTILSDTTPGGTWSVSGIAANASVGSASGVVTGTSPGTAIIVYTSVVGCTASAVVTVNAAPAPIVGLGNVCVGGYTYPGDPTAGGTWSSSNISVATIDPATGAVTGVSGGTAVISYVLGSGCSAIDTMIVNSAIGTISGGGALCVGQTITLTDTSSGGLWSSSTLLIATVGSTTGMVYGASGGTTTITYLLPSGCFTTAVVTVNSSPGSITGTTHVCIGATTSLSDLAGGGTWSSSNPATATVGSISGIVGGILSGTVTVTYSVGGGCNATAVVTVNPLPSPVTGVASVCVGATTTLADGGLGIWSTTAVTIATVGSASGAVTGILSGTATITYTLPTGCFAIKVVTVNSLPAAILGTLNVCPGSATSLSSPPGGGTWSSASTLIATVVSGTGVVTGVAPGTSLVTYTAPVTGCTRNAIVTVNPLPALFTVTGGGSYCAGDTGRHIGLSGSVSGVSYQLFNGAAPSGAALIGTSGSLDFGVHSSGTYTVMATSTTAGGCSRQMTGTVTITVNPLPSPVTGPSAVCVSSTIVETGGISGGTWVSGTPSVATVTAGPAGGGTVTGVATGVTLITYTLPTGCSATTTVTVSLSPTAIIGAAAVCSGSATTLTDAVSGGSWTSSNTTAATIGSLTGTVTGASPGVTTITYSLGTGCTVIRSITVNATPAAITGATAVCVGVATPLGDLTTGGVWSSSTTALATVTPGGIVTGAGSGVDTISYAYAGCAVFTLLTVNPAPALITGIPNVCVGATTLLGDAVTGGTWASGSTSVATVGTGGVVSGAGSGTTIITYSLGAGCSTTKSVTVNPISPIAGTMGICVGSATTLTDAAGPGTWATGTPSVATATGVGIFTGLVSGTSVITYTTGAGCAATATITVNAAPAAIGGTKHVCVGATTALNDIAGGGTWTSSNMSVATVITASGLVSGVTPGTSIITYSLGSGCTTFTTVTVDPSPSPVSGSSTVCINASVPLSDATPGGTWGSSNVAIASVVAGGLVTGTGSGVATITYTPPTGCYAIKMITVNPLPAPEAGPASVCVGMSASFSDSDTAGTWSTGSAGIATVSATGSVSGAAPGSTTIVYTLPTGCSAAVPLIVHAAPAPVTGSPILCVG